MFNVWHPGRIKMNSFGTLGGKHRSLSTWISVTLELVNYSLRGGSLSAEARGLFTHSSTLTGLRQWWCPGGRVWYFKLATRWHCGKLCPDGAADTQEIFHCHLERGWMFFSVMTAGEMNRTSVKAQISCIISWSKMWLVVFLNFNYLN